MKRLRMNYFAPNGRVRASPTELQEAVGGNYTCSRGAGYCEGCLLNELNLPPLMVY